MALSNHFKRGVSLLRLIVIVQRPGQIGDEEENRAQSDHEPAPAATGTRATTIQSMARETGMRNSRGQTKARNILVRRAGLREESTVNAVAGLASSKISRGNAAFETRRPNDPRQLLTLIEDETAAPNLLGRPMAEGIREYLLSASPEFCERLRARRAVRSLEIRLCDHRER